MKTLIVLLALCGTASAGSPYVRVQAGASFYNQRGNPGYGYYDGHGHHHGPYYGAPYLVPYFVPPAPIYIPPPREGSYLDRQAKARAAKQAMSARDK